MNSNYFLQLIRIKDQISVLFAIVIAALAYSLSINALLIPFIIFIISLSSFTFIINDLADVKLDKLNKETRNLIAKGKVSKKAAINFSILFFTFSIVSLRFLPEGTSILGAILIFLSITYSFFIRSKSRPLFDVVYHGLGPVIVFLMLTGFYKPIDANTIFSAVIVFCIFAVIELLQELRDFDTDKKMIVNTAIILKKKKTILAALYITLFVILFFVTLILSKVFPLKYVFYLPLFYFLVTPLLKAFKSYRFSNKLVSNYRSRLIIAAFLFLIISLLLSFI